MGHGNAPLERIFTTQHSLWPGFPSSARLFDNQGAGKHPPAVDDDNACTVHNSMRVLGLRSLRVRARPL